MISYDFQAGTYVTEYEKNKEWTMKYVSRLADYISTKQRKKEKMAIMEAGVGEATMLLPVLSSLKDSFDHVYGFDISWSRIKVAKDFISKTAFTNISLFVGDLFCIPLKNDAIDIIYTRHAIEPNGGKEKEILKELYRVTKSYLILVEPAYEFASEEARQRMLEHGYVTNLYQSAIDLGYKVVEYSLYGMSINPLNPSGFLVIEKDGEDSNDGKEMKNALCCPVTKTDLQKVDGGYYSTQSLLAYPVSGGVPCLTKQNAILATKMLG